MHHTPTEKAFLQLAASEKLDKAIRYIVKQKNWHFSSPIVPGLANDTIKMFGIPEQSDEASIIATLIDYKEGEIYFYNEFSKLHDENKLLKSKLSRKKAPTPPES